MVSILQAYFPSTDRLSTSLLTELISLVHGQAISKVTETGLITIFSMQVYLKFSRLNWEKESVLFESWFSSLRLPEFLDSCFCYVEWHANYLTNQNCNGWQCQHKSTSQLNLFVLSIHDKTERSPRTDSSKYNDLWKLFTGKRSDIKRDKVVQSNTEQESDWCYTRIRQKCHIYIEWILPH